MGMNDVTLKKSAIIDKHFGELVFIEYENEIISDLVIDYFGHPISIDYYSHSQLEHNILDVKGFIRFDEIRIPFSFSGDMHSKKGHSIDIYLYYDVVYSRSKEFKEDNYYNIKSSIKNVLREQVEDYTQKLIACLPSKHSKDLTDVLSFLYFYPHIDTKNGKTLKVFIDMNRKSIIYFINHYQSTSTRFNSNLSFFYDGETFSLNSSNFTSVDVSDVTIEDCWKHLMARHFRYSNIYSFINSSYTSLNELMAHIDEAFLVFEMDNI
jgi:hypothetical protein